MKEHAVIDLTAPDMDKLITPEDVMNIPEFFAGYERSNSGGVTAGLPMPKYREADAESQSRQVLQTQTGVHVRDEKNSSNRIVPRFPAWRPSLAPVNPKYKWDKALQEHNQKSGATRPDLAQTKYLAAKGDTDLDGHLIIRGLPTGNYWVSSLGLDAAAGDRRLIWDVPVTVQPGAPHRSFSPI